MKNTYRSILAVVALAIFNVSTATVQAQFTYTTDNGTITITRYTGPGGDVIIPGEINGLPVTSIGGRAFSNCSGLTTISIPDSVTTIEYTAFIYCEDLVSIAVNPLNPVYGSVDGILFNKNQAVIIRFPEGRAGTYAIPDGVTKVGDAAFFGCRRLSDILLPHSVTTIGNESFSGCYRLPKIIIPSSVTSIGNIAFCWCTGLTDIKLPAGITNLGYSAFNSCKNLASITLPDKIVSIGDWTFRFCTNLSTISIPSSVIRLGGCVFEGCSRLTSVYFDGNAPSTSQNVFEDVYSATIYYYWGTAGWEPTFSGRPTQALNVPAYTVTTDGTVTITGYSSLTDGVTIVDTIQGLPVTTIGGAAFRACSSLTRVTIPDSVTSIGEVAFWGSANLTHVTIGRGVTTIGDAAFCHCTGLTTVIIPNSVTNLGRWAFWGCTNLLKVYFEGTAPLTSREVLDNATNATVYYLPGTSGWGATFSGRPTTPWLPRIEVERPTSRIQGNSPRFSITWARDKVVVIEASTALANPVWSPVSTNTLTDGWSYFSDAEWTNYPAQFYRVRQW